MAEGSSTEHILAGSQMSKYLVSVWLSEGAVQPPDFCLGPLNILIHYLHDLHGFGL